MKQVQMSTRLVVMAYSRGGGGRGEGGGREGLQGEGEESCGRGFLGPRASLPSEVKSRRGQM